MRRPPIGRLVAVLLVSALAGCGQAVVASPQSRGDAPVVSSSPAPVGATAGASTPPTPAAGAPSAPPSSPITRQAPMTFAIVPLFPAGAAGTITVLLAGGVAHYHAVITGLAPRSTHTIHDHAGTCAGGLGSRHLSVLAVATADARGVIVFDATVPSREFGAGRIVLVYQSSRATIIAGCATL